jgi:hypothetical protein
MTYTAWDKTRDLQTRQYKVTSIPLSFKDAETLRKAELTINRWDVQGCGWLTPGPNGSSIALVRDEDGDGKPYLEIHPNVGLKTRWVRIPDRQAGALRRVAEVCKRNRLEFYHQGDPRGCSLYISRAGSGMNNTNYPSFVPCAVR